MTFKRGESGPLRQQIMAMAHRPNGVAKSEILGIDPKTVESCFLRLLKVPELWAVAVTTDRHRRRYFASEAAADAYKLRNITNGLTLTKRSEGRTYHKAPSGPVVIPKHVKVQICPSGRDTRLDPDPGYIGGFLREWRELTA